MKVQASLQLVWQFAGQEAIAAEFQEIEPEHFFAALLKFAELPSAEIERLAPGAEEVRELITAVVAVRATIEERNIDSTAARRKVREVLGKGKAAFDGGEKHRSAASRLLFATAARIAGEQGEEALAPNHLLAAILFAPTPAISQVLGDGAANAPRRGAPRRLLDLHGRDLTGLAASGKLVGDPARKPECQAILDALGRRRNMVLIASSDAAQAVVASVAVAMALREGASMKATHLLDLSSLAASEPSALPKLLAEAAEEKHVVLYLPPIDVAATQISDGWLRGTLAKSAAPWICRVDPATYRQSMEKDPEWRALAQPMWIREVGDNNIPPEL